MNGGKVEEKESHLYSYEEAVEKFGNGRYQLILFRKIFLSLLIFLLFDLRHVPPVLLLSQSSFLALLHLSISNFPHL